DPAEVAYTRQSNRDQPIEELIHTVAAKCHHRTDVHSLAKLERSDRLLSLRHDGLLTRDRTKFFRSRIKDLCVRTRFSEAHVDDHLGDLRHRHRVLDIELLRQGSGDLVLILFSKSCHLFDYPCLGLSRIW